MPVHICTRTQSFVICKYLRYDFEKTPFTAIGDRWRGREVTPYGAARFTEITNLDKFLHMSYNVTVIGQWPKQYDKTRRNLIL